MYQKRTMRRASPHTCELMRLANEAEQHWKRLKRLARRSSCRLWYYLLYYAPLDYEGGF